jgi:four helix bundle protein
MQSNKPNLIVELTFQFAVEIIKYAQSLHDRKQFVIGNQLLRSGTSIGANVREAQNAESKADFIHKMKIAAKEADETQYWLELCQNSNYADCTLLIQKCISVQKVLSKIISSSKAVN